MCPVVAVQVWARLQSCEGEMGVKGSKAQLTHAAVRRLLFLTDVARELSFFPDGLLCRTFLKGAASAPQISNIPGRGPGS